MFKSSGFFKAVPCLYFVRGSCRRPYCHFRHTKEAAVLFWPKDLLNSVENGPDKEGDFPLNDIITTSDWASGLAKEEAAGVAPRKPAYSVAKSETLSLATPILPVNTSTVVCSPPKTSGFASDSNSDFYDVFGSDSENEASRDLVKGVANGSKIPQIEPTKGDSHASSVTATPQASRDFPGKGSFPVSSGGSTDEDFAAFVEQEVTEGESELLRAEQLFHQALRPAPAGGGGSSAVSPGPEGGGGALMDRPSASEASVAVQAPGLQRKRTAHSNPGAICDASLKRSKVSKSRVNLPSPNDVFSGRKRETLQRSPASSTPEVGGAVRPRIAVAGSTKVPSSTRQRFLDAFIDEMLKMAPTAADAYQKASADEELLMSRVPNKMLYTSLASNHVRKLRGLAKASGQPSTSSSTRGSPSSTRESPSSTRGSPSSTRESPSSTRESPSSTRESPSSTRGSPSSIRSSPFSTGSTASTTSTAAGGRPAAAQFYRSKQETGSSLPDQPTPTTSRTSVKPVKRVQKGLKGLKRIPKKSPSDAPLPSDLRPVGILYTVPGRNGQYFISHQSGAELDSRSHDLSKDLSHDLFGSSDEEGGSV